MQVLNTGLTRVSLAAGGRTFSIVIAGEIKCYIYRYDLEVIDFVCNFIMDC